MDDSLKALEARLERLVPKGLSDLGLERMEARIDELAAGVREDGSSGTGWKWRVAGAAAVAAMLGWAAWTPEAVPAGDVVASAVVPVDSSIVSSGEGGFEDVAEDVLTLAMARRVEDRVDRGWVADHGETTPHRYWSYEVTNEEELMDAESGYAVRVLSRQEEWVPVKMTSL